MCVLPGPDSDAATTFRGTARAALLMLVIASGCGDHPEGEPTSATPGAVSPSPPASLREIRADAEPQPQGPAAWLAEIARLRTVPNTVVEIRVENGQKIETGRRSATQAEFAAEHRKRLEKIVDLAGMTINEVHDAPEQQQIFNNAVHYLTDARLQLAILGSTDQSRDLTEDAEALFERDKTSFAAVEAGHKVVQLAESMAALNGAQNREWVREYAKQAQLFALRFPQEEGRAAVSLIAAGRKCEQHGLPDDAMQCYLKIEQQFAGTIFADQIAGILRRLRLEGQPLELAGPTIDGGFFSADAFAGHPMLVVFWASGSATFRRDMAILKQISETYKEQELTIVGICLDEQEASVDKFLEEYGVAWRQIFFADPNQRAARNPVARYYGVHVTPTYWLVDGKGIVTAAPAAISNLSARVAQLVKDTPTQTAAKPTGDTTN